MNDILAFLRDIDLARLIAVISGLLGLLGLVYKGLAVLFRHISEPRAHQVLKEHYHEEHAKRQEAERKLQLAVEKIDRLTATLTIDGASFFQFPDFPHDKSPICPKCLVPLGMDGSFRFCPCGFRITAAKAADSARKLDHWRKDKGKTTDDVPCR